MVLSRDGVLAAWLAAGLLACCPARAGSAADPLGSPACVAARARLETVLANARPGSATSPALQAARRRAASACLGHDADPRERSGAPQPPVHVPRADATPIERPLTQAPPATPRAFDPLPAPRAATLTGCDPGGCWDSEGRRLVPMGPGPVFAGPRGPCIVEAGVARCP